MMSSVFAGTESAAGWRIEENDVCGWAITQAVNGFTILHYSD
jgi:hypothetical protein